MVDLLHLTHDGGIRLSTCLLPSPQGFRFQSFYYCQLLAINHKPLVSFSILPSLFFISSIKWYNYNNRPLLTKITIGGPLAKGARAFEFHCWRFKFRFTAVLGSWRTTKTGRYELDMISFQCCALQSSISNCRFKLCLIAKNGWIEHSYGELSSKFLISI